MTGRGPGEDVGALEEEIARTATHLRSLVRRLAEARSGRDAPGEDESVGFARRLLSMRRLREAMLGPQFFADPAWDMLLDLYVQRGRERPVSVSTLCLAAAVPGTTALRCLNNLVAAGLLVRRADPEDGRRALVAFAPGAEESMRVLLARAHAEMTEPHLDR